MSNQKDNRIEEPFKPENTPPPPQVMDPSERPKRKRKIPNDNNDSKPKTNKKPKTEPVKD